MTKIDHVSPMEAMIVGVILSDMEYFSFVVVCPDSHVTVYTEAPRSQARLALALAVFMNSL